MTTGRAVALLSAVVAGCALPLAAAAAPLPAQSDQAAARSWTAVAAADGVRVAVVVKDFLVVSNVVDAGGPAAQSVVDAFGDSRGYAAYPYPGEIVLTAHGLSQGAAPKYPLIAQSDATQPTSDVTAGPYRLHAQSTDDRSAAVAHASAGGGDISVGTTTSTATAAHDPDNGAVTAEAETTIDGVSIAGVLWIGRVHSYARMFSAPGEPVQRRTDTELADMNVGGQAVGITDKGLVLAGTDVPLPPDSTANALLSVAGITVHYVAPARTAASTVAPGLSVSVVQDVPGVGETTVSYVFGQAAVTAQATGASAATDVPSVGAGATPAPSVGAGVAGPSATSGASGSAPIGSAAIAGGAPGAAPVTAGAPQLPQTGGYALAGSSKPSSESLYVVIAAGAVVMVAAAQLFRILAVKLVWT